MSEQLPVHTLVAFNTATASENKIHDDEVAGALGFGGGLVPGVDVFAYLCQPPVAHWGVEFLTRGRASARFSTPVYDGERVDVKAERFDDGHLSVAVHPPTQSIAATMEAALDDDPPAPPSVERATRPDPEERPPASPETLAEGTVMGSLRFTGTAEEQEAYLSSVRDERSPVTELGLVHPGRLLRLANSSLAMSVRLGPWIHVGSVVHNYAPVALGEEIRVNGRVTANREHKGHRFVDLDVVLVGPDGDVRSWVEHTAIYEPRQLREHAAS